MAWALRAGAVIAANAAPAGATFNVGNLGAATVVGDRIIFAVDGSLVASQPHCISVSSTGGGAIEWARDLFLQAFHNSYFEELSIWSGVCQASGSVTAITATFAASLSGGGCSGAAAAFSGLSPGFGLAIDQNGLQDIISGGFASGTPRTALDSKATLIGTNKANQLIIGATADAGASSTLSVGSGFTLAAKSDANSNGECLLEYKDSGVAGLPQQATATASIGIFDMTAVLVYRIYAGNTQLASKRPAPYAPGLAR
jgi:hypothetical protein